MIKQEKIGLKLKTGGGGIKKLCEVFVKDSEREKCCFIT